MAGETIPLARDEGRLAALARYRVMDTLRESGFDDLAALASEICGTPIAVVNLVDSDRQWFKAEVGLGVDSTPLETSFCGTAILEDEFLLVPDATQDRRFACNPLVTGEPGLRFYAGAVLKSPDGFAIGTLCVLDYEPRSLTDRQQRALRKLARQVMAQLELRLALIEREEVNAKLRSLNETLETRIAEALAERRLLADLVEGTDAFVQVADSDFRWLAVNKAAADEFERIYGTRPKVGASMLDVLADRPEHQAAVRDIWARALGGEAFTQTLEFGDPGRDRRFYEMKYNVLRDADGRQIGAYQFVYDVTGRAQEQAALALAQDALRQSQKMESMGQLTGGVAHDFNNLLTPIVGALDMLQRKALGGEREQRLVGAAVQSAERARVLVQRLLAFARRQPLQSVAVDVAELVTGMADLVSSTTGPQIKVAVDVPDDLPPAKTDANQLEMALLNLAVNARDAMPDGGSLRISAFADVVTADRDLTLRPGRYICVSVADTGFGMDEATQARAIEPFFSTKGVGKGTGLGLSMVHGLASQLGGALAIRSTPGAGTTVDLWLPQAEGMPAAPLIAHQIELAEAPGMALLVDDEEFVRLSTADMLADLGYRVTEVASAEEALRVIDGGARFDLVVTDHLMSGMTGTELARAIRDRHASLPVLLMSGYAEIGGIAPDLPRIIKPFRKDELAASLAGLSSSATSRAKST